MYRNHLLSCAQGKGLYILAALALLAPCALRADPVDWTAYKKGFTVSFPGYRGTTTLENFPVLVRLSAELNGFDYARCAANGADLRFSDAEGNLIPSEIDTWNPNGESLVWVKVPVFNKDAIIKAHYGCSNPAVIDPKDVWSPNDVAVWHMSDDGKTMTDSSSGGTSLTEANKSGMSDSIHSGQPGLFGNAVEFGTSADHSGSLRTLDQRYRTSGADNFTVEFWSYQDSFDPAAMPNNMTFMREVESAKQNTVWYFYEIKSTGYGSPGKSVLQIARDGADMVTLSTGSIVPPRGEWTYQHLRVIDTVKFYEGINDNLYLSYTLNGQPGVTNVVGNTTLYIGNSGISSTAGFLGKIDEVRISNVARSEDWMKAMYDMGTNTFFTAYELNNDWSKYAYKFTVSFTNYTGSTTLESFPMPVRLSEFDETNGTGIEGFRYSDFQKADGADLHFADADGNLLPSEIETWNTSGESVAWVSLPTLAPNGENKITAYYGWTFAPYAISADVWSNGYVAVWHMNGDGTGMTDSSKVGTTLTEHSTNAGKNLYGQEGIVGTAVEFDHDGSHKGGLESREHRFTLAGASSFTVEVWAKQDIYDPDENPLDRYMVYLDEAQYSSPWVTPWSWRDIKTGAGKNGKTCFTIYDGSLKADGSADPKYLQNNNRTPPWKQWNYQVVRYDGSRYVHKLNTEQLATASYNSITNVSATAFYVGNSSRSASDAYSGKLDEIRISSVPRSDDWIQATYDSIKIPAAYSRVVPNIAATIIIFK